MSFDSVLGQDAAVRLLVRSIEADRVGSGYLFHGPEGVGKQLVAGAFARALLCAKGAPGGAACGVCPSCVRSAAGSHPGLLAVEREPKKTRIVIAQIHELSSRLALRPVEGERQVVVLTEAERMNEESFNALLKTLEEPPPGSTLVLATANLEAIPETIRSRCQAVRFRPLPREIVVKILVERMDRTPEEAGLLARLSGGSMTRVASILALHMPEEGAAAALSGRGADDDAALARTWSAMVADKEAPVKRERTDTVLRALMEGARAELIESPTLAGTEKRMRLLTRAIEDNRLNIAADTLFRSLAVGWIDAAKIGLE